MLKSKKCFWIVTDSSVVTAIRYQMSHIAHCFGAFFCRLDAICLRLNNVLVEIVVYVGHVSTKKTINCF